MANVTPHPAAKKQRSNKTSAGEWVGGRFSMPGYVMEGETPYRPDVAVWLETDGPFVVGTHLMGPKEPAGKTVDCLVDAMKKPLVGPTREPTKIRVADPELASLIRKRLGKTIKVNVAPTPELDEVMAEMSKGLAQGDDQEPSYLEGGQVSAETLARFFKTAAKLYDQAPWEYLADDEVLQLDIPDLGINGACVSIIGALGESFGALIFDSIDGFEAMARVSEAAMTRGDSPINLQTRLCSINFERGSDIPKPMRREISKHAWKVAGPRAYPIVHWVDPDLLVRPMLDKDYVFVTACADALASFFQRHGPGLDDEDGPITASFTVKDLPGNPTVTITSPHPDTDWIDGDEIDSDEDFDDDLDDDLDEAMAAGRAIADEFVEAMEREGRDEEWLKAAGFLSEGLLNFKVNYGNGETDGWSAGLVEEYLIDYFPQKVSADDDLVNRTPEVLAAFFSWMRESGRLSKRLEEAIQKRIKSKTKAFALAARDPSNFGMAKSFFTQMSDAGVDISDASEVNGYIKGYNASLGSGHGLRGNPLVSALAGTRARNNNPAGGKAEAPRRPAKKAWVWSGEGTAPDRKAPCPCGSGRPYKKCCMPR